MDQKINEYIDNPNLFVRDLNKSIDLYIKSKEQEKSAEWRARNDGTKVSGSVFSQCVRKAWYSYFTPASEGEFSLDSRKKMFLGYINEEILLASMNLNLSESRVEVHHEQNVPPVNQVITRDTINLSTTTDFVLEFPGKIYIPIEAKNTEAPDFRPAKDWWAKFTGSESHRRQLAQWMYYAKENGLNVPFGVLLYTRRANYDTKEYILMDTGEPPFSPTGTSSIELYSDWRDSVEERIKELVVSIDSKTRPSFPRDVPSWLCSSCSFKKDCHGNK